MLHDKDRVSVKGNFYLFIYLFETITLKWCLKPSTTGLKTAPRGTAVRMMQRGSNRVHCLEKHESGSFLLLCY